MTTNEQQREALIEELKIKQICRFCLTQVQGKLSNIYSKDGPVKSLVPLTVEIMAIASIEVFLDDGMPPTVCLKCRLIFDYCYRFKQMCKKGESLLNQVPLLGEWPTPLMQPNVPAELLPKKCSSQMKDESKSMSTQKVEEELQQTSIEIVVQKTAAPSMPKKILNSNPAALPEPPIPARTKQKSIKTKSSFLTKVENNEEISIDDIQRLIAAESDENEANEQQTNEESATTTISRNKTTPIKPKVLNKASIRILNKDAEINVEPRLKQPRVSHDIDGNVSLITEILDPNEPYPDPIKDAEPVKTNVFPCPDCNRTFPLLQLRDIHMVNHRRERRFQCDQCDRSFFSKYDLQKHVVIHTGELKYKCTVCEKGFARPALLYRHEKIHTDIPKYLCVYCEKPFLSKQDMEKHTERHRKNRPFKCKECDKAFAFKQGLERHEVVHATDKPYPCEYCEKSFLTPSQLARHLVAHAGNRPFPCKFCSKSYLLSHHLSRHLRTHKESVVMYSCNECDQSFKTCEKLVLHSTVHATTTLTCPLCKQVFDDVHSVTAHIKEHARADSFPCEFCDLIFLTNNEQIEHVQSMHAYDLAAYNEDENNTRQAQRTSDEHELEEAIEEFLYEETTAADEDKINVTNVNDAKFESMDISKHEISQNYVEGDETYEEEYLNTDEPTNIENPIDADMLTDITIEQVQEPMPKKTKTEIQESFLMEATPSSRRALRTERETTEEENKTTHTQRIIGAEKTNAISRKQIQKKKNTNEYAPTSSSKQLRKSCRNLPQMVVKKEWENNQNVNACSTQSGNTSGVVVDTETNPTGDTVVKMRIGEKRMIVQKIVVTKSEAAAMAKDGRISIKDGNLILTTRSQK